MSEIEKQEESLEPVLPVPTYESEQEAIPVPVAADVPTGEPEATLTGLSEVSPKAAVDLFVERRDAKRAKKEARKAKAAAEKDAKRSARRAKRAEATERAAEIAERTDGAGSTAAEVERVQDRQASLTPLTKAELAALADGAVVVAARRQIKGSAALAARWRIGPLIRRDEVGAWRRYSDGKGKGGLARDRIGRAAYQFVLTAAEVLGGTAKAATGRCPTGAAICDLAEALYLKSGRNDRTSLKSGRAYFVEYLDPNGFGYLERV